MSNQRFIDATWFTQMGLRMSIGIVLTENEDDPTDRRVYIGVGEGLSERTDAARIMHYGGKLLPEIVDQLYKFYHDGESRPVFEDRQGRGWFVEQREDGSITVYYIEPNVPLRYVVYDSLNPSLIELMKQHEDHLRQMSALVIERQKLASMVNTLANIVLDGKIIDNDRLTAEIAIKEVIGLL